jgi:ubiquinone/menaquinone biosynthesis C-methylase UbiE
VAATLAKFWGVSVVTLEIWESLKDIQDYSIEQGVGNQVLPLNVNAKCMPFADDSFDAVLAIGAFFMIDERETALKEMIRVTRKEGCIGIAEPMCTQIPISIELNQFHNALRSNYRLAENQGLVF